MAKQQKTVTSKTTTTNIGGRKMTLKNGNFNVSANGKKVKPTSQDSALYNAAATSQRAQVKKMNNMFPKQAAKGILANTLKKKR